MKQYKLKDASGKFFVTGKGFSTTVEASASSLDEAQIKCLLGLGFTDFEQIESSRSYAVVYIRRGEGIKLLGGSRKNVPDADKGQVDPSKRRFATWDEAHQHGSRFPERRAEKCDKAGTAGHEGFFVIETGDPVNAKVNWKSGKTNPLS